MRHHHLSRLIQRRLKQPKLKELKKQKLRERKRLKLALSHKNKRKILRDIQTLTLSHMLFFQTLFTLITLITLTLLLDQKLLINTTVKLSIDLQWKVESHFLNKEEISLLKDIILHLIHKNKQVPIHHHLVMLLKLKVGLKVMLETPKKLKKMLKKPKLMLNSKNLPRNKKQQKKQRKQRKILLLKRRTKILKDIQILTSSLIQFFQILYIMTKWKR